MIWSLVRRARAQTRWLLAGSLGFALFSQQAFAEESGGGKVVAIEEDWELIVKEPDDETQAPQVTCIISPDDGSLFAAFNLNHKSFPEYDPGGLHLQLWNGEVPLGSAAFPDDSSLRTNNEVVTWTTRMEVKEGQLRFEIVAGSSNTWGTFGGTGTLKAAISSSAENLNQYDPANSVGNSGIGYASNRVTSLKLKGVRKILHSGDVVEDNSSRTVYPQD